MLQAPADTYATEQAWGRRIAALRQQTGLSQRDFAERIGVPYATFHQWEKGARYPSVLGLGAMCRQFRVSPVWLMEGPGEVPVFEAPKVDWAEVARRLVEGAYAAGWSVDPEWLAKSMRSLANGDLSKWEQRVDDIVSGVPFKR